ncbi:MAG: hypothetical protein ACK4HV_07280, partial [Parachlamydiaceae bacterium]
DKADSAKRLTIGFFKNVALKVGLAKDKATDTIGQKPPQTALKNEIETRASRTEARKSQNVFISFLDKNAKCNDILNDPLSTKENKANALKEFISAYDKLPAKDKEAYRSELSDALKRGTLNDSKVDNIMKETLATEKSFLGNIKNILGGLDKLENDPKIPKSELARMKEEYKTLEKELSKNVQALDEIGKSALCDAEKLLLLKEHITLSQNSSYGRAMDRAVFSMEKNKSIIDKSLNAENKIMLNQNIIAPIQRGPRYVLLTADLEKKHSDPVFKAMANDLNNEIKSNVARWNRELPK